jgi:hypothetical protein
VRGGVADGFDIVIVGGPNFGGDRKLFAFGWRSASGAAKPGRNAGSVPKFLPAARQGRLVVDVKHDCVWLDHAVTAVEGELFRFTCSGICVLRVRRLPLKGIDL